MTVNRRRGWTFFGTCLSGLAALVGLSSYLSGGAPTIAERAQNIRALNQLHHLYKTAESVDGDTLSFKTGNDAEKMHQNWDNWDNNPRK